VSSNQVVPMSLTLDKALGRSLFGWTLQDIDTCSGHPGHCTPMLLLHENGAVSGRLQAMLHNPCVVWRGLLQQTKETNVALAEAVRREAGIFFGRSKRMQRMLSPLFGGQVDYTNTTHTTHPHCIEAQGLGCTQFVENRKRRRATVKGLWHIESWGQ